jgi:chemotaxis protein MotB
VTAMMAFFLLMWLLNATTEAQKRGLADYFTPTITTNKGTSGSGQPFGGKSPFDDGPAISDKGTLATMNAAAPPVDVDDDGSDTLAVKTVHSEAAAGLANPAIRMAAPAPRRGSWKKPRSRTQPAPCRKPSPPIRNWRRSANNSPST